MAALPTLHVVTTADAKPAAHTALRPLLFRVRRVYAQAIVHVFSCAFLALLLQTVAS